MTFIVLIAILAAMVYDSNTRIVTNTYDLTFADLPAAFEGYRIALVSDVHATEFGEHNKKLIAAVRNARPDMIALTGDLIDDMGQLDIVLPLVRALADIAPVYYITGNHEWDSGNVRELLSALPDYGAVVLQNRVIRIERGGAELALVGLEDPNGPADMKKPAEVFASVPDGMFSVTLVHRNTYLGVISELGGDLILCGHAHGGIVEVPLLLPNGLYDQTGFLPKYTNGVYTSGSTTMVVSRGLGNVYGIPRLMNNPHVPVVVLHGT